MIEALTAPFAYEFMQRAFLAAIIVGALCSTIGTFVVLRRLSFIGDGIAHASFAGIVVAYLRGFDYIIGAAVVAVISALGISYVNRRGVALDTAIGVIFTGTFALGVFLMSRVTRYSVDLQDFLFGNILAVTSHDLFLVAGTAIAITLGVIVLFRALIFTSFDPIVAKASGIAADRIDTVLLVMLALTIVVSLESVGIILVAALLVTPAAAAALLTKRYTTMLPLSIAIGTGCSVGGLYASYYLRAASGASIVLAVTLAFGAALGIATMKKRALPSR